MEVWKIEEFEKTSVPEKYFGHMFSFDSYIVLYTYNDHGTEKNLLYFWQGRDSSIVSIFLQNDEVCIFVDIFFFS